MVFDDTLSSKGTLKNDVFFFAGARPKKFDVYFWSQSDFDSPQKISKNRDIIILFKQFSEVVENILRETAGFGMPLAKNHGLCSKLWIEKFKFLDVEKLEEKE